MNKNLLKKIKEIKQDDSFLVSITIFDKKEDGKLDTYVFSNKFPYEEFEGTKKMIGKLIDEHKKTGLK